MLLWRLLNRNYINRLYFGIRNKAVFIAWFIFDDLDWFLYLYEFGVVTRARRVETITIQHRLNRIWSGTFVLYWNLNRVLYVKYTERERAFGELSARIDGWMLPLVL